MRDLRQTHLSRPAYGTACGTGPRLSNGYPDARPLRVTSDPARVTCARCRQVTGQ